MGFKCWLHELFTTHSRILTTLLKEPFENIMVKGENVVTSIFFFSYNVFYCFQNKFQFLGYVYFVVYKCFEFGLIQNFVVCLRVKALDVNSFYHGRVLH